MIDCKYFQVAEWRVLEWEGVYHPLGVRQELEKMTQWLTANPKRRKKSYHRFVINWLAKAHAQVVAAQIKTRDGYRNATVGRGPDVESNPEHVQRILAAIEESHRTGQSADEILKRGAFLA